MLLESGDIQCPDGTDDAPYCPSGCSICDTCLTLLGCAETRPENKFRKSFSGGILWYMLAAALGVLLGLVAMSIHRNSNNEGKKPLEENLVERRAGNSEDDGWLWLVPVT